MPAPDKLVIDPVLELGSNKTRSWWGANDRVRYRKYADTFSLQGWMCQILGVSPNCVLAKRTVEMVQPVQVRWSSMERAKATAGITTPQSDTALVPNGYMMANGVEKYAGAGNGNKPNDMQETCVFDSLCIRPYAIMNATKSAILTYNGCSFSVRPTQYQSFLERVYLDGTVEEVTGQASASYPFNNYGAPNRADSEKGRYERCRDCTNAASLLYTDYGTISGVEQPVDQIWEYRIRSRLFLGPWLFEAFPNLAAESGNSCGSIPFCQSLTLEINYKDDLPIHLFSFPSIDESNQLAVISPTGVTVDDSGDFVPCLRQMWTHAIADDNGLVSGGTVNQARTTNRFICLRRPYLEYEFQDSPSQLPQVLSLAHNTFTCYDEQIQFAGAVDAQAQCTFSGIKLNSIPQIFAIYCEDCEDDYGLNIGARQFKHNTAGEAKYMRAPAGGGPVASVDAIGRFGGAYSKVMYPLDLSTLRVVISTSSSVLANFDNEKLGISQKTLYRNFKRYSKNRLGLSFQQFLESSQMLLFTASDLNLDVYAGQYKSISVSISVKFSKPAYWTKAKNARLLEADGMQAANDPYVAVNAICRMVMVFPAEIQLEEGSCTEKAIYWLKSEAASLNNKGVGVEIGHEKDGSGGLHDY